MYRRLRRLFRSVEIQYFGIGRCSQAFEFVARAMGLADGTEYGERSFTRFSKCIPSDT
jgi:hypothetical protein